MCNSQWNAIVTSHRQFRRAIPECSASYRLRMSVGLQMTHVDPQIDVAWKPGATLSHRIFFRSPPLIHLSYNQQHMVISMRFLHQSYQPKHTPYNFCLTHCGPFNSRDLLVLMKETILFVVVCLRARTHICTHILLPSLFYFYLPQFYR